MQLAVFQHDKTAATVVVTYPNLEEMLLKTTLLTENF